MGDLNTRSPELLLARLDVSIDEQSLVIRKKELRIAEMDEEVANIRRDVETMTARVGDAGTRLAAITVKTSREALAAGVVKAEFELAVKQKKVRLLELAEEREAVTSDIDASQAHIDALKAEVAQQNDRLKERNTHG